MFEAADETGTTKLGDSSFSGLARLDLPGVVLRLRQCLQFSHLCSTFHSSDAVGFGGDPVHDVERDLR
jgi:hypothetical protein